MTNFEKITASPEALGEFLASLPVATGPWDKEFHMQFCTACLYLGCDKCPHEQERNKPLWWLRQGEKQGEVEGLTIRIKGAFPIEWGKEYYTIAETKKERRAPCPCCDDTGKVVIKGVEYTCPKCKGDWREKKVIGATSVYSVAKWVLEKVSATPQDTDPWRTKLVLTFRQTNNKESYSKTMEIREYDLRKMIKTDYGDGTKIYDDYKAVMAEIKRLNAAERGKQESNA